jgi:ferrochelatase
VPELRTVLSYHDEPGYVRALGRSVREAWGAEGPAERVLFSFHGIPQRYADAGDPYPGECRRTAELLAAELDLPPERWQMSFQSLFGREEWVKPYTDRTVKGLAQSGVRSLDVLCPGFAADCLETLDEIDVLNRGFFLGAGGERFRFVRCLNDRRDHLEFLTDLARRQLAGWVTPRASAPAPA